MDPGSTILGKQLDTYLTLLLGVLTPSKHQKSLWKPPLQKKNLLFR